MSDELIRDHQDDVTDVTDTARPRSEEDPPHSGTGSKSGGFPVPAAGSEDAEKARPRSEEDPPHSGTGSKTGGFPVAAG